MSKIFVCYSRHDKKLVDEFVEFLERHYPNDVWLDRKFIRGGDRWWVEEILPAINECHVFVYLFSPASAKSSYCKAELKEARRQRKRILPVLVKEGMKVDALRKFGLQEYHCLEMQRPQKEDWESLRDAAQKQLNKFEPLPPTHNRPTKSPRRHWFSPSLAGLMGVVRDPSWQFFGFIVAVIFGLTQSGTLLSTPTLTPVPTMQTGITPTDTFTLTSTIAYTITSSYTPTTAVSSIRTNTVIPTEPATLTFIAIPTVTNTPTATMTVITTLTNTLTPSVTASTIPTATATPTPTQTEAQTPTITVTVTDMILSATSNPTPTPPSVLQDVEIRSLSVPSSQGILNIEILEGNLCISEQSCTRLRIMLKPVSNLAYNYCVNAGNCGLPDNQTEFRNPVNQDDAVISISQIQAREYCETLTGRLPSLIEWVSSALFLELGNEQVSEGWQEWIQDSSSENIISFSSRNPFVIVFGRRNEEQFSQNLGFRCVFPLP